MSLWGCQVGSQFLQCAGTLYTLPERLLLGGLLIVMVSVAAFVVVRLVNPN